MYVIIEFLLFLYLAPFLKHERNLSSGKSKLNEINNISNAKTVGQNINNVSVNSIVSNNNNHLKPKGRVVSKNILSQMELFNNTSTSTNLVKAQEQNLSLNNSIKRISLTESNRSNNKSFDLLIHDNPLFTTPGSLSSPSFSANSSCLNDSEKPTASSNTLSSPTFSYDRIPPPPKRPPPTKLPNISSPLSKPLPAHGRTPSNLSFKSKDKSPSTFKLNDNKNSSSTTLFESQEILDCEKVLFEIYASEESYISQLQIFSNCFLKPIIKSASDDSDSLILNLTVEDCKLIFSNIEHIFEVNKKFLEDIRFISIYVFILFLSLCRF